MKTGEPFEVTDTELDERIPQYPVKRYGIRAYLGIPLAVNDSVVGSFCVIDTQPGSFSDEERKVLSELGTLANRRLDEISKKRRHLRSSLLSQAIVPGLSELRDCLGLIQKASDSANRAAVEAGPPLRIALHAVGTGLTAVEDINHALKSTQRVLGSCQDAFDEIAMSIGNADDALTALEHAVTNTTSETLATIAVSGRELARQSIEPVGGVVLPDIDENIVVSTPRSQAIVLIATCLSLTAAQMANQNLSGGSRMDVHDLGSWAEVTIVSNEATELAYSDIVAKLAQHVGSEPDYPHLRSQKLSLTSTSQYVHFTLTGNNRIEVGSFTKCKKMLLLR